MAKLIKTRVYDKITNRNEIADFVECCNCGETMLVDLGSEVCPMCGKDGYLKWADSEVDEVNKYDFENQFKEDYILIES
jgi:hypothetical protein